MRIKGVALVGALLISVSAPSAFAEGVETVGSFGSTTINKNTQDKQLITEAFSVVADVDYVFSVFVGKIENGEEGKSLIASLLDSANTVISSLTIQSNSLAPDGGTYSSGFLNLTEGFYKIAFQYSGTGGKNTVYNGTSATLSHNVQTVAVPGPEAGAGLGALAMGGMMFYLKRRKNKRALPS